MNTFVQPLPSRFVQSFLKRIIVTPIVNPRPERVNIGVSFVSPPKKFVQPLSVKVQPPVSMGNFYPSREKKERDKHKCFYLSLVLSCTIDFLLIGAYTPRLEAE